MLIKISDTSRMRGATAPVGREDIGVYGALTGRKQLHMARRGRSRRFALYGRVRLEGDQDRDYSECHGDYGGDCGHEARYPTRLLQTAGRVRRPLMVMEVVVAMEVEQASAQVAAQARRRCSAPPLIRSDQRRGQRRQSC
jgi:hypothetical protein